MIKRHALVSLYLEFRLLHRCISFWCSQLANVSVSLSLSRGRIDENWICKVSPPPREKDKCAESAPLSVDWARRKAREFAIDRCSGKFISSWSTGGIRGLWEKARETQSLRRIRWGSRLIRVLEQTPLDVFLIDGNRAKLGSDIYRRKQLNSRMPESMRRIRRRWEILTFHPHRGKPDLVPLTSARPFLPRPPSPQAVILRAINFNSSQESPNYRRYSACIRSLRIFTVHLSLDPSRPSCAF